MTTKAECLRYPGQPDTHTRDELIEYFEALAAKAADRERVEEVPETFLTTAGMFGDVGFPKLKITKRCPHLWHIQKPAAHLRYRCPKCGAVK